MHYEIEKAHGAELPAAMEEVRASVLEKFETDAKLVNQVNVAAFRNELESHCTFMLGAGILAAILIPATNAGIIAVALALVLAVASIAFIRRECRNEELDIVELKIDGQYHEYINLRDKKSMGVSPYARMNPVRIFKPVMVDCSIHWDISRDEYTEVIRMSSVWRARKIVNLYHGRRAQINKLLMAL